MLSIFKIVCSAVVVLGTLFAAQAAPQTGSLCLIFYSVKGDIEFPWATSTLVNLQYDDTPLLGGAAVAVTGGSGVRTFTNKFGESFSVTFQVAKNGTDFSDNLLYINGTVVDGKGLTWGSLSTPVQMPGHGPINLLKNINVFTDSAGVIVEQDSFIIDPNSQAFASNIPGFVNRTLSRTNRNNAATDLNRCTATINRSNGLVSRPSGPTSLSYSYSYFVSDGATYQVIANLTLTANSTTPTRDQLGNDFQFIVNITGTRDYYFGVPPFTTPTLHSVVNGESLSQFGSASQRIYPFALSQLGSTYTTNTAPFLDFDGIEYGVTPSVPVDGNSTGTLKSAVSVFVFSRQSGFDLEEGSAHTFPLSSLQQQLLTLN